MSTFIIKREIKKKEREIKKEKEGDLSLPPPSYLLFRVCCKYIKFVVKRVIIILYYYHTMLPACTCNTIDVFSLSIFEKKLAGAKNSYLFHRCVLIFSFLFL